MNMTPLLQVAETIMCIVNSFIAMYKHPSIEVRHHDMIASRIKYHRKDISGPAHDQMIMQVETFGREIDIVSC